MRFETYLKLKLIINGVRFMKIMIYLPKNEKKKCIILLIKIANQTTIRYWYVHTLRQTFSMINIRSSNYIKYVLELFIWLYFCY